MPSHISYPQVTFCIQLTWHCMYCVRCYIWCFRWLTTLLCRVFLHLNVAVLQIVVEYTKLVWLTVPFIFALGLNSYTLQNIKGNIWLGIIFTCLPTSYIFSTYYSRIVKYRCLVYLTVWIRILKENVKKVRDVDWLKDVLGIARDRSY